MRTAATPPTTMRLRVSFVVEQFNSRSAVVMLLLSEPRWFLIEAAMGLPLKSNRMRKC